MSEKEWKELIWNKSEELIEVGKQAYKDAWNNRRLQFTVELTCDGEIYTWYSVAGSNNFKASNLTGESMPVIKFCHQYAEISGEDTEGYFREVMEEQGRQQELQTLEEEKKKEGYCSLLSLIYQSHDGEYIEELEEADRRYIEWDIEEYGREQAESQIEQYIFQHIA